MTWREAAPHGAMITPKEGFGPVPDRDAEGAADDSRTASPEEGLEVGSRIGGFTLEELVGESETGTVYRASRDGRSCALKLFRPGASPDPEILRRLREVEFRHPNLAGLESFGEEAGLVFVTRSLLRGDSLARILQTPPSSPGFPVRSDGRPEAGFYRHVVGLFADVADGLHEAHEQGLVHGGIHPGNLVFSPSGRLVLTDFGEDLATGAVEPYLAPEQRADLDAEQGVPLDAGTDVYSLAAVLHRVLTGTEQPAEARNDLDAEGASQRELSSDLRTVLSRALSRDREARYASAADFAGDLRRVLVLEAPREPGDPDDPGEEDPDADRLVEDSPRSADDARGEREEGFGVSSSRSVAGETSTDAVSAQTARELSVDPPTATSTAPFPERESDGRRAESIPSDRGGVDPALSSPGPLIARANASPLRTRPRGEVLQDGASAAGELRGVNVESDSLHARQLLFDAIDPDAVPERPREARLPRRLLLGYAVAFTLVVVAATLLALHLHDLSGVYRANAVRLGRGARQLVHATLALGDDRSLQAAETLAMARETLSPVPPEVQDVGVEEISDLEARLRSLSRDPILARLKSTDPLVKAAAIDALRGEVASGKRPSSDLGAVAELLRSDDPGVARRAIRACAEGERYDELVERFPVGPDQPPIRLPAGVFEELYGAWGEGALAGVAPARTLFLELGFDGPSRLDAGIEAGTESDVELAPNLSVHGLADSRSRGFVRRWLGVASVLDGDSVLRELPRLERREDLVRETVAALERVGSPLAVRALRRFTLSRSHRCGEAGIDALARLAEAEILADMADERIPVEMRAHAIGKAAALESGPGDAKVASLIRRHPDPAIRRAALKALARPGFVAQHPGALVAAVADPYLRDEALELLGDELPASAVDPLLVLLGTSDLGLRIRVVRVLGRSAGEAALLPLARQLRETSPALRRETLLALADLGDDRAIPLATGLLEPGHEGLLELARTLLERNATALKENRGLLVLALVEILEIGSADSESYGLKSWRRNLLLDRLGVEHDLVDRALPARLREVLGLPPS